MQFIVLFTPYRGPRFEDMNPSSYLDWQADHGPAMDAPAWVPSGGSTARDAGMVGGKQAWVDSGYLLRLNPYTRQ